MAEIGNITATQNTEQTNSTAVWGDVSGAQLSGFTTGHEYLILVQAVRRNTGSSDSAVLRLVHGSTPTEFAGSEDFYEGPAAAFGATYFYFTVWTAVSGETVDLQLRRAGGQTAAVDEIRMVALDLDDLASTDWYYDEDTTSTELPNGWTSSNNAAVTFTPGASGDWLVLTGARLDLAAESANTGQFRSRIVRSGEASSSLPDCQREGENSDGVERITQSPFRVFALTAASNTFTQESGKNVAATTGVDRTRSAVFALRLAAFEDADWEWTEAQVQTDSYTDVGSGTYTPQTASGDHLCIAGSQFVPATASDVGLIGRLRLDSTSNLYYTGDATNGRMCRAFDSADEMWCSMMAIAPSLSAASHTVAYEALNDTTGVSTRGPAQRSFVMFSLELADTARQAIVTAFELETGNAARKAIATAFELEVPTAPRKAIVSAFELETGNAGRQALVTAFELETGDAGRQALVTAFELEVPTAPRKAIVTAFELEVGAATEQEGYRWRDDDDIEADATWLQLQDVDITRAKNTNTRLRVLIEIDGDESTATATLQYRKVGDAEWTTVPVVP
jgi:hypothetical protein